MKIRRGIGFVILTIIIVSLMACGSNEESSTSNEEGSASDEESSASDETYTIKASHTTQEGSNMDDTYKKFKEVVEEKSEGRITVEVYGAGQLAPGDEDTLQGIMNGSIEVGSIATLVMTEIVSDFKIFDFPYLFNLDNAQSFTESDIYAKMAEDFAEETGAYIMSTYALGPYGIINSKNAIKEPSDFEGLKIRTPQASIIMDTFEAWDANPTPMAYGEVFTAIQQGVVDGLITTGELIYSDRFFENAKFYTDLNHNLSVHPLLINQEFLDNLPSDLQEVVLESANEATDFGWKIAKDKYQDALKGLKAEGVEITELTDEDIEEFKKAVQPAIDNNIDSVGKEFYEKVKKEVNN